MSALDKAIGLIEQQRALKGHYPYEIQLVQYPGAEQFEAAHPGEDYIAAMIARAHLVQWCQARKIRVVTVEAHSPTVAEAQMGPEAQARRAATEFRSSYRPKGTPYTLGVNMSARPPNGAAVGWFQVWHGTWHKGGGGTL